MYDVITMGSATIDTFARSKSKLIKIFDQKGESDLLAFQVGSKVLIDDLHYSCGGGGTNTAAAFAHLGLSVAFLGKVGAGHNSQLVLEILRKHKVDTSLIATGEGHTGASIILDSSEEDRVILTHKGINDQLRLEDVPLDALKTKWIYSSSLVGESFNTLIRVVKSAKRRGIKVAFNPSLYQVEKGIAALRSVLSCTTALILNRVEAETLTGKEHLKDIFSAIHKAGPVIVAVTQGKEGVHVSDGDAYYFAEPIRVKVADATGAGDAFASTFIAGLIRKKPLAACIRMGVLNASSVIRKVGAKEGLLTWANATRDLRKVRVKKSSLSSGIA